jgi:hypothetical protein
VTTGYTNGAQLHKKEIRPPDEAELVFMPHHLGLTRLSLDARPLARLGARSAQIWLLYRPPTWRDELRQAFQFGESNWKAHWWLATQDESLLRHLSYRWTATTADGRKISQAETQPRSSDIVLSFPGGTTDVADR